MRLTILESPSRTVLVEREVVFYNPPSAGDIIEIELIGHTVRRMVMFSKTNKKEDSLEIWVGR